MQKIMRSLWVSVVTILVFAKSSHQFRPMKAHSLPTAALNSALFRDYPQIPPWLVQSCESLGFSIATEVQKRAIPEIFDGTDVVIQAHTGSGKTLAYGIPLLSRIDANHAAIQAVVVVPTRELGFQVTTVLKQLASTSPKRMMIMSVVEGSKNRRQMLWAAAEPPHIVVGNPKALQKLVDMGKLRLNAVDVVVLDEVDACLIEPDTKQELHKLLSRHLSSSFTTAEEALNVNVRENRVFRDLAKDQKQQMGFGEKYHMKRQTIMCSATIPQRQHFAATCFKNGWTATTPELINVSADELVPAHVTHTHIPCPPELRMACLAHILRSELSGNMRASAYSTAGTSDGLDGTETVPHQGAQTVPTLSISLPAQAQAIVFLDEKQIGDVDRYRGVIQAVLDEQGGTANIDKASNEWQVGILLDTMSLDARHNTMQRFRDGETRVLVCSDMAARGLDLPNTSLVVQMSLPNRVENYIHRAGRTGRLSRPGRVVTFTTPEEDFVVQRFSNEIGVPIAVKRLKSTASSTANNIMDNNSKSQSPLQPQESVVRKGRKVVKAAARKKSL